MPPRNPSGQSDLDQPQVAETAAPQRPAAPAAAWAPANRRSILRGAAGAGVVAAAAAAGAGAVAAIDRSSAATLMPASKPVVMAPMAPTAMAGPLVVWIADTTTGQLDVFGGAGATQVRNPALVRQLLANLKLA